jgi:hypothetical protein
MKNVNTKRKTESDIRIFKDWLSTVGEHHNSEYIGVEEMYMHLARFFFSAHEIQTGLRTNVSKLPSVDIYAIVSTIENYENRTVTPIFISNNSVQSAVTNDNAIKQTVIDLAPILPNSRITLFSYSNIQGNVTKNFYLFIYNLFISVMVKYVINRL